MRSFSVAVTLPAITLIVAVGTSCSESVPERLSNPTPLPAPKVLTATARTLETSGLVVELTGTLSAPGNIYVEYANSSHGRFQSRPVRSNQNTYTVHATRLRADTIYEYQVFGTDLHGGTTTGPTGTFETGPLPKVLEESRFKVYAGQPTRPITFLEYRQKGFMGLAAVDSEGEIVWYFKGADGIPDEPTGEQPYSMARRPNGNIVYIAGFQGGTTGKGLVEIKPTGEEIARLVDECSPYGPIHHEVQILRDGRVMYLSREIQWEGFGNPAHPQEGDTIGIWNPSTGKNQIMWNIFDHIAPSDRTAPDSDRRLPGFPVWGGCDRDRSVQDWSHANSAVMAEDGSVLVSLRHLDQIVSISPDFKKIQWRIVGPGSHYVFPQASDRFYEPHTAIPLANGHILMFDNGNDRPNEEGGQYSRALELEVDHKNKTVRKIWEFVHDPIIFSVCCSSVERLPNGNTLVLFGSNFLPDPRPFKIMEITPEGQVAWDVLHQSREKQNQYRVYSADSIMEEQRIE